MRFPHNIQIQQRSLPNTVLGNTPALVAGYAAQIKNQDDDEIIRGSWDSRFLILLPFSALEIIRMADTALTVNVRFLPLDGAFDPFYGVADNNFRTEVVSTIIRTGYIEIIYNIISFNPAGA